MPRQIHGVVQDAQYEDPIVWIFAVEKKMPSVATSARDVKSVEAWTDIVAGNAAGHVGAGRERGERLEQDDFRSIRPKI